MRVIPYPVDVGTTRRHALVITWITTRERPTRISRRRCHCQARRSQGSAARISRAAHGDVRYNLISAFADVSSTRRVSIALQLTQNRSKTKRSVKMPGSLDFANSARGFSVSLVTYVSK